ncbi:hypothetical protein [Rhodococcus chondri]|uniref:LisH domain-containing protein n=1 Tax=Rhodococcus chondri TaxID=3065941 RepID=A0ABU7JPE2_9NOCA|nr:hypothetical protein [Rhodococcus sp. CC-R104]MEE2031612.1 hypothetical protein [Rhodococcus sp. CC-R104]
MNDDSSASPTDGLPSGKKTDAAAKGGTPKRSGTFIYPLPSTPLPSSTPLASTAGESAIDVSPAGGVGAGTTNEGTSLVSSTSTNGTTTGSATSDPLGAVTPGLGTPAAGTPSRRNSMGVASVRIAARLAHTEMSTRASRGPGSHADPTIDNDELLTLLGEYLLAGGLEKPEIHASLGGQPIVVDLQAPQRFNR